MPGQVFQPVTADGRVSLSELRAMAAELFRLGNVSGTPGIRVLQNAGGVQLSPDFPTPSDPDFYARVRAAASPPAAAYVSKATAAGTGTLTVSQPAGLAAEDLLIAVVGQAAGAAGNVAAPAGWSAGATAATTGLSYALFYRLVSDLAAEPASYAFAPVAGTPAAAAAVYALRNSGWPEVEQAPAGGGPSSTITTAQPASTDGDVRTAFVAFLGLAGAAPAPQSPLTDRGGAAAGGSVALAAGTAIPVPGAVGAGYTATQASSTRWLAAALHVPPAPAAHGWDEVAQDDAGRWFLVAGGRSGSGSAGLQSLDGRGLNQGVVCRAWKAPAGTHYLGVPVEHEQTVRVSSSDRAASYLAAKLLAGTNVALTGGAGAVGEALTAKAFTTWTQNGASPPTYGQITLVQADRVGAGLTVSNPTGSTVLITQQAATAALPGCVSTADQFLGGGVKSFAGVGVAWTTTPQTNDAVFTAADPGGGLPAVVSLMRRDGGDFCPLAAGPVTASGDLASTAGVLAIQGTTGRTGTLALGAAATGGSVSGLGAASTITGSRGGNAALQSLLTALATAGMIVDSTT